MSDDEDAFQDEYDDGSDGGDYEYNDGLLGDGDDDEEGEAHLLVQDDELVESEADGKFADDLAVENEDGPISGMDARVHPDEDEPPDADLSDPILAEEDADADAQKDDVDDEDDLLLRAEEDIDPLDGSHEDEEGEEGGEEENEAEDGDVRDDPDTEEEDEQGADGTRGVSAVPHAHHDAFRRIQEEMERMDLAEAEQEQAAGGASGARARATVHAAAAAASPAKKQKLGNAGTPLLPVPLSEAERLEKNWKSVHLFHIRHLHQMNGRHSYETAANKLMVQAQQLHARMQNASAPTVTSFADMMAPGPLAAAAASTPSAAPWLWSQNDKVQQLAIWLKMKQVTYASQHVSDDRHVPAASVRIDEYTMRAPPVNFHLDKSSCTDNTYYTQYVASKTRMYHLWRVFHTIHARMRAQGRHLLHGYPDMDFNAFQRTFVLRPTRTAHGVAVEDPDRVAPVSYFSSTAYGPADAPRVMRTHEDFRRDAVCRTAAPVDDDKHFVLFDTKTENAIRLQLTSYFATTRTFYTETHPAGLVRAPTVGDVNAHGNGRMDTRTQTLPPLHLKMRPRGSDILHVCFALAGETSPGLFSRLVPHLQAERSRFAPLPIHHVMLVANVAAKMMQKIDALRTDRIKESMRCEFDVWPFETLLFDPYNVWCVSRHKLSPTYTPEIQNMLQSVASAPLAALTRALQYRRLVDTDIICRFLGFQRGNIVYVWNMWEQGERNAVPHLVVAEKEPVDYGWPRGTFPPST